MDHKTSETTADRNREILSNLTDKDFLSLGMEDLAYIRPIVLEGKKVYAVHAADGVPLSVSEDFDTALSAITDQDMQATTVQ